jgi:hypothetical protein
MQDRPRSQSEESGASDGQRRRKPLLVVAVAAWTLAAGAIGAVLDAEINDRWRRPTRAVEIREFCLTSLRRPPDGRSRDELWFDTSVTVRLVGYEDRRVGVFSEYIKSDGDRDDTFTLDDGEDVVEPDANDRTLVLNDQVGIRAHRNSTSGIVMYLTDQFGPVVSNLAERTVMVKVNARGRPKAAYKCVGT